MYTLYKEDNPNPINSPAFILTNDADPAPGLYTATINIEEWDMAKLSFNYDPYVVMINDAYYANYRNEMMAKFLAGWGGYNDEEKRALIRNYIWPDGTPDVELDALYATDERDTFRSETIANMARTNCNPAFISMNAVDSGSCKVFAVKEDNTVLIQTVSHFTPLAFS